jgi:hypothetical protein
MLHYRAKDDEPRLNEVAEPSSFSYRSPIPLRRRLPPPKTTLAAAMLLFWGTVMLIMGLSFYFGGSGKEDYDRGLTMMVLGGLMFLPGSFSSWTLLGAYLQWRDYDYAQVPSYEDVGF